MDNFYPSLLNGGKVMWTKPEAIDIRYGFEVTMYVMNR